MLFGNTYLRVLTPITTNGVNPRISDGQVEYRETYLPYTAKRHLDELNMKLPDHLKKQIEVIGKEPEARGGSVRNIIRANSGVNTESVADVMAKAAKK